MGLIEVIILSLILLVVAGVAIVMLLNREAERKQRMMQIIQGQVAASQNNSEEDEQNKRRADIAQKLKNSKIEDEDGKDKSTISDALGQAGLDISVKQFWIYSVVSMVIFTFLAFISGQPIFVVIMVAIIALLGIPRLVLRQMAQKRQKKFLEEFADALEATVRLLKAGMPVSEAIAMISKEFSGPVGEEMLRIYDKQKIGVPLHEAAHEATKRMPLTEMAMFATGLAIQAQTGSSLSEVLSNLAGVIRARFRLKRKVKALASEAVASAGIIGALPIIVAGGMWFVNREYINILFTTGDGKVLLGVAIGMMCTGIFVMRAMINFKV